MNIIGKYKVKKLGLFDIESGWNRVSVDELMGMEETEEVIQAKEMSETTMVVSEDGTISIRIVPSPETIAEAKAEGEEITDFAEKVYTYCFTLMDNSGNIIETSGEQIHNSSQDTEQFESIDTYTIKFDLEKNKTYFLEYKIKTNNTLEKSVRTKSIMKVSSIDSNLKTDLKGRKSYLK